MYISIEDKHDQDQIVISCLKTLILSPVWSWGDSISTSTCMPKTLYSKHMYFKIQIYQTTQNGAFGGKYKKTTTNKHVIQLKFLVKHVCGKMVHGFNDFVFNP